MPLAITTRGFNEGLDLPLLTPARQREADGQSPVPVRSGRAPVIPASPRATALYKAKITARDYHRAQHVNIGVLRSGKCRECALEQVEATLEAAAPAFDGTAYRLVALHAGDHRYLHAALTAAHPDEWVRQLRTEALVARVHGQVHAHLRLHPHARLGADVLREHALPTVRHLRRVYYGLRSQGHPVMLGATHLPSWVLRCDASEQVFEDFDALTGLDQLDVHAEQPEQAQVAPAPEVVLPAARGTYVHPKIPAPRRAVEQEWLHEVAPTG